MQSFYILNCSGLYIKSVRNYFDITITLTENGNSITMPMYNSFDFDDEGKILFLQYYGDFTAAFLSLEE